MIQDKCWHYAGNQSNNGYGIIRSEVAHRFIYRHLVGEIPEGLQLDHLCGTKICINPEHLEPVTRLENMQRYFKTYKCKQGHKIEGDNRLTYTYKGIEQGRCKACYNAYKRTYKRPSLRHG